MNDEPLSAALQVIDALEKLNVAYYVGGSLASSTYGEYRASLGADLIADLDNQHVAPLVKELGADFYADEEMIGDAVSRKSSFNLIHLRLASKVDVFIPGNRPFDRLKFQRRILQTIAHDPPRSVYVASPEDTILAKLEWYRLGHEVSERQWRDVLGVLRVQGDHLDHGYLRQWAAELAVADLLTKAFGETGMG